MQRPTWITHLLEKGAASFSSISSCEGRLILKELQALGLVRLEAKTHQSRVIVCDAAQFMQWVEARYPQYAIDENIPTRAQNILALGTSKARKATHNVQPLLLRWFDGNQLTVYGSWTATYGMIGVTSDHIHELVLPQVWRLLTIENWEPFCTVRYQTPQLPIIAVYLGGQVADLTLQTLASLASRPQSVLHFGDYDWTGLNIFLRVRRFLPQAVLYVHQNIELLFQQHSSRNVLEGQTFQSLLNEQHSECRQIVDLISKYNGGVEQEVVPLPSESDFEI